MNLFNDRKTILCPLSIHCLVQGSPLPLSKVVNQTWAIIGVLMLTSIIPSIPLALDSVNESSEHSSLVIEYFPVNRSLA